MPAMSSDRNINRSLKPNLAPAKVARSPLTPRVAISTTPTPSSRPLAPRVSSKASLVSPRTGPSDETIGKDVIGSGNITPRSTARKSRVEGSQDSPSQDEGSVGVRPWNMVGTTSILSDKTSNTGTSATTTSSLGRRRLSKSPSSVGDGPARNGVSSTTLRSPALSAASTTTSSNDTIDSRFFHASDVHRQEPQPKKPEQKKAAAFFYADGQVDQTEVPPKSVSPVLSTVSDKRTTAPWLRPDWPPNSTKSTPATPPSLNFLSAPSPFFPSGPTPQNQARPLSPSKENIHLSYRKGASQIFGSRPPARPTLSYHDFPNSTIPEDQRPSSLSPYHRKSPSLSSIDSGHSYKSRRRSATAVDSNAPHTSATTEPVPGLATRVSNTAEALPSIDTSLASTAGTRSPDGALSPTKSVNELAADARRERKVLDLEISNSSLLAINASLEREVRRQKAELKRFRRLSRAGRFSLASEDYTGRQSDAMSTPRDDLEGDDEDALGPPSGFSDVYDTSDSEGEDSVGSGDAGISSNDQTLRDQKRLVQDEKRLRIDLHRHKELLVQSQMMNQSLKRCMYATEEMIREGKKALQYHVRVSDVKLGGRILTGHEDDEEDTHDVVDIEIEDEVLTGAEDSMESAKGLLDVWKGVGRRTVEGSEVSGDRDSGIEVDKLLISITTADQQSPDHDEERPFLLDDHLQNETLLPQSAKPPQEGGFL